MIRLLLVIQVSNARDQRSVALHFGPGDRVILGAEVREHVIGVIFDNVPFDRASLRPAFRAGLYEHVGHRIPPIGQGDCLSRQYDDQSKSRRICSSMHPDTLPEAPSGHGWVREIKQDGNR